MCIIRVFYFLNHTSVFLRANGTIIRECSNFGRRSAEYFGADPIFTYYIFSTYDSITKWYNTDDKKRLDKLTEI